MIMFKLLFKLIFECFTDQHHIHLYVEDAINQLLEYKEDHPKVIPSKFFAD